MHTFFFAPNAVDQPRHFMLEVKLVFCSRICNDASTVSIFYVLNVGFFVAAEDSVITNLNPENHGAFCAMI